MALLLIAAHLRIFERNDLGDWPQPGPRGCTGKRSLLPDPSRYYELSARVIVTSEGSKRRRRETILANRKCTRDVK